MEQIEIRKVNIGDVRQLQKIGIQTFTESFSDVNTEENMLQYLEQAFSEERLEKELNDPHSEFYFAFSEAEVIGYIKLNSGQAQTELKDKKGLEIERIYVSKEFQGKNVGQKLYEKSLQVADKIDADYVWLGVWEENPNAIRFYKRNGFKEFDRHVFMLGEDKQWDIMMRLELK